MAYSLTDAVEGDKKIPTDAILKLLENGKWHYIKDIEKATHLNSDKIETVTKFLESYNFVKIDETKQKVKIDPPTNKFLKKIQRLEKREQ